MSILEVYHMYVHRFRTSPAGDLPYVSDCDRYTQLDYFLSLGSFGGSELKPVQTLMSAQGADEMRLDTLVELAMEIGFEPVVLPCLDKEPVPQPILCSLIEEYRAKWPSLVSDVLEDPTTVFATASHNALYG